ncbi:MAG: DUF4339 domain-containing protein [Planctomycetota bacterium]
MGIRFHCTHCQRRLNVKVAQAGSTGQCPHCRKTVKIPLESNAVSSSAKARSGRFVTAGKLPEESFDDRSEILDVDDQDTLDGPLAGEHEITPPEAKTDKGFRKAAPKVQPVVTKSNDAFLLSRPSPSPTMGKVDPIEQAPQKVWHFRTRGFGQRGPIKGKKMREHLENGDVMIGSMVWREDWDDWVKAEDVFPELADKAKKDRQQARLKKAMQESGLDKKETIQPTLSPEEELRRRRVKIFYWMTGIGLAIIAALVIVIMQILAS